MQKTTRRTAARITPLLIALIAGAAASTIAAEPQAQRDAAGNTAAAQQNHRRFMLGSGLIGLNLENRADEDMGEIEDLVINRGTGRIEYALIKSGDVLGMGGRTVAVPFARLSDDPRRDDDTMIIDLTADQLRQWGDAVPENWCDRNTGWWGDDLDDRYHDDTGLNRTKDRDIGQPDQRTDRDNDARDRAANEAEDDLDPYAVAIAAATEEAMGGEVIAVHREHANAPLHNDEMVVVIRDQTGQTRELIAGPSWYTSGQTHPPMRGDKLDARVRVVTKDGANPRYYISSATVDGERIIFRDDAGRPVWNRGNSYNNNNNNNRDRNNPGSTNNSNNNVTDTRSTEGYNIGTSDDHRRDRTNDANRNDNPERNNTADRRGSDTGRGNQDTSAPGRDRTADNTHNRAGGSLDRSGTRSMLLSELIGSRARVLNEDGGAINDVIVETTSGRIAFICFDPNSNFLGIADTVRLVPWSVAYVGYDGSVRIDATKEMIESAMEAPTDLTGWNTGTGYTNAYRSFKVDAPEFRRWDGRNDNLNNTDRNRRDNARPNDTFPNNPSRDNNNQNPNRNDRDR
ncbi:MAG: PRC-barrel domain-containing protein [Planctomycetota bacterium]|nr:PRC-barrel domain-containing protein [Planctomycetota bacterium]